VAEQPLKVLQVNAVDTPGGAAVIAFRLHQTYRQWGLKSNIVVSTKRSGDLDVTELRRRNWIDAWARAWSRIGGRLQSLPVKPVLAKRLHECADLIGQPSRAVQSLRGEEDFDFPATWRILDTVKERPDVVHCHNLHDRYFDLRALPWLSHQVPVVITLHDAWLLSGHCAHALGCGRWQTGCGNCPDLTTYPALRRDGTRFNWQRKARIYASSRLYVATPCQWLMDKVELSMLKPAVVESRVIPNGVDVSAFRVGDKRAARHALGIAQSPLVLLTAGASRLRQSPWRDYDALRNAVAKASERLGDKDLLLMVLGEEAPAERMGRARVHFVRHQSDPSRVAQYYQAADLLVHPARADTFPLVVIEAQACGLPVVATAAGGIPEQLCGLRGSSAGSSEAESNRYQLEAATGVLVPVGDTEGMASALVLLLGSESLRIRLGRNAARRVDEHFGPGRQARAYLEWYRSILERWNGGRAGEHSQKHESPLLSEGTPGNRP
jgi:glycosyltransferase involved in cell wall biosynthesis